MDVELIKNVFLSFSYHLISTQLVKLKLKSQVENIEYKFINKEGFFWEKNYNVMKATNDIFEATSKILRILLQRE